MLTILHTADWHLGQSFHGYDRDVEHTRFLDWLALTLHEQAADVLLIAGDVFDSINPPAIAQKRLFEFLARATALCPQLQIVMTAGNHDAGSRLEAPAALLESLRISVVGTTQRNADGTIDLLRMLVPLTNASGHVAAIAVAVPYLRPSDVPHGADAVDPYLAGIRELYHQATTAAIALRDARYPGATIIALGHCHMQGGEESKDSERSLVIGHAESLRPDTFPAELRYIALGHLHRPQRHDNGRIVYSGSPIPLSFSERTYAHSVVKLTIDDAGQLTTDRITIPRCVELIRYPDGPARPIDEILSGMALATGPACTESQGPAASALPLDSLLPPADSDPALWPFLEVVVLATGPDPERRVRLEQALLNKPVRFASLKIEVVRTDVAVESSSGIVSLADLKSLDPERILTEAWREQFQCDPEPAVMTAFREVVLAETVQG